MTVVNGSKNNDDLDAGAGNDVMYGKGGNDIMHGHRGDDIMFGGNGDDILAGGPGADHLNGTGGDKGTGEVDVLIGGKGADVFHLGDNSTVYYIGEFDADFAKVMGFNASEDTLRLSGSASDYSFGVSSNGKHTEISFGGDLVGVVQMNSDIAGIQAATQYV